MRLRLRPVGPDDEPFLYAVYAGTRQEELALVDWDEAQRAAFLRMQFTAQQRSYQVHFPDADYSVILADERPIGRLSIARQPDAIHIIDIALLPDHRNRGIGGALLREALAEAAEAGKPVRLRVARFNRALGLYTRLGFRPIADEGVYLLLEWSPGAP